MTALVQAFSRASTLRAKTRNRYAKNSRDFQLRRAGFVPCALRADRLGSQPRAPSDVNE